MRKPITKLGRTFLDASREVGGISLLLGRIATRVIRGDLDGPEFKRCLLHAGWRSLSIIIASAVLLGVILVIQAFVFVDRYGTRSQLGWGAGFTTIRELGPVLFALMFSGRVGAFTTAELGTMQVTDQIDGLRCLAIDPISYLIVPRFLASIISLTLLTIIGNTVSLVTSSIIGQVLMEVDQHTFWSGLFDKLNHWDYFTSVFKSMAFGAIIAASSCHFGLTASGGAPGVGAAVNRAVVASATLIFVVDFFSTFVLG